MDGATQVAEVHVRTVADTNCQVRGLSDQDRDGQADVL
jgi:hypothetical protein